MGNNPQQIYNSLINSGISSSDATAAINQLNPNFTPSTIKLGDSSDATAGTQVTLADGSNGIVGKNGTVMSQLTYDTGIVDTGNIKAYVAEHDIVLNQGNGDKIIMNPTGSQDSYKNAPTQNFGKIVSVDDNGVTTVVMPDGSTNVLLASGQSSRSSGLARSEPRAMVKEAFDAIFKIGK
jgi:hypothetical protein